MGLEGINLDDLHKADVLMAGEVLIWGEHLLKPTTGKLLNLSVSVMQLGKLTQQEIEEVRKIKASQHK